MAKRLYTLEVCIIEGPMTEAFIEANPVVCRTMEIREEHTLGRLREAIFEAFGCWERHMYEFQLESGPHDPEGDRYGISLPFEMPPDPSDTPGDDQATVLSVEGRWQRACRGPLRRCERSARHGSPPEREGGSIMDTYKETRSAGHTSAIRRRSPYTHTSGPTEFRMIKATI
jgi:hypothetical protein